MTETVLDPGPLPVGPSDRHTASWWGVLCLIATEGALFAYLLFTYYYFDVQLTHNWRPDAPPKFDISIPETVVMLLSGVAVFVGERALASGRRLLSFLGLLAGFLLGCGFIVLQVFEWKEKKLLPESGAYGSVFFTTEGLDMAHAGAGVLALLFILIWMALGYFDARRNAAVSNTAAYWYFVNIVWVAIFVTFYVTPYMW